MLELTVRRHIAAPPARVWDIMVNRLEEWWSPKPWRTEILAQERRAGGRCSFTMYGPEGEVIPNEGVFLAWDEGRRFVTIDAVNAAFEPSAPFMVGIWEVAADGDGTLYTASARHWTEEAMREHEAMGYDEGWGACADQLQALCEGAA